jgi:hypothetical protein
MVVSALCSISVWMMRRLGVILQIIVAAEGRTELCDSAAIESVAIALDELEHYTQAWLGDVSDGGSKMVGPLGFESSLPASGRRRRLTTAILEGAANLERSERWWPQLDSVRTRSESGWTVSTN